MIVSSFPARRAACDETVEGIWSAGRRGDSRLSRHGDQRLDCCSVRNGSECLEYRDNTAELDAASHQPQFELFPSSLESPVDRRHRHTEPLGNLPLRKPLQVMHHQRFAVLVREILELFVEQLLFIGLTDCSKFVGGRHCFHGKHLLFPAPAFGERAHGDAVRHTVQPTCQRPLLADTAG